jgi:hypothetical protein
VNLSVPVILITVDTISQHTGLYIFNLLMHIDSETLQDSLNNPTNVYLDIYASKFLNFRRRVQRRMYYL